MLYWKRRKNTMRIAQVVRLIVSMKSKEVSLTETCPIFGSSLSAQVHPSMHLLSFLCNMFIVLLFRVYLFNFSYPPSLCSMLLVYQLFSSNIWTQFSGFNL
jgi:hypothetical protein